MSWLRKRTPGELAERAAAALSAGRLRRARRLCVKGLRGAPNDVRETLEAVLARSRETERSARLSKARELHDTHGCLTARAARQLRLALSLSDTPEQRAEACELLATSTRARAAAATAAVIRGWAASRSWANASWLEQVFGDTLLDAFESGRGLAPLTDGSASAWLLTKESGVTATIGVRPWIHDGMAWLRHLVTVAEDRGVERLVTLGERDAFDVLTERGWVVDNASLHGEVEAAYVSMASTTHPAERLAAMDLSARPIGDASEAAAMATMFHDVLVTEPQTVPAAVGMDVEEYAARRREQLSEHDPEAGLTYFGIWRGDTIVGTIGWHVGSSRGAGLEIVLRPEVRGRGVGKLAYALALRSMHERGVERFSGMTRNPAVLALARRMRRRVVSVDYVRADYPWSEAVGALLRQQLH